VTHAPDHHAVRLDLIANDDPLGNIERSNGIEVFDIGRMRSTSASAAKVHTDRP
jgi:hypothetical protein